MALSAIAARKLATEQKIRIEASNVPIATPSQETGYLSDSKTYNTQTNDPVDTSLPSRHETVAGKKRKRQPHKARKQAQGPTETDPSVLSQLPPTRTPENHLLIVEDRTYPSRVSPSSVHRQQDGNYVQASEDEDVGVHSDDDAQPTPAFSEVLLSTVKEMNIRYTDVFESPSAIVSLSQGEILVAIGQYDLWVRKGVVTVCGAILQPGSKVYRVYAASSHALPTISVPPKLYGGGSVTAEIVLLSCQNGLRSLRRLNPNFARLWNHGHPARQRSFQILQSSTDDCLKRPLRPLYHTAAQTDFVTSMVNLVRSDQPGPSLLVCGPKGSGKSTLSRTLTNALLSTRHDQGVAYMDIDPGQPEFGPPGDLSLSIIREHSFGPSYTHPICEEGTNQLLRSHHYGFITPRDDQENYIECVADLYETHLKNCSNLPLIINCSGWILGSGLECVEALIMRIRPSHIVYMSTEGPQDVIDFLQNHAGQHGSGLHTLASNAVSLVQKSSADLRSMQWLSYFHSWGQEGGKLRWNGIPIHEIQEQAWSYAGTDPIIAGIMPYSDEINPEMLEYLVDGSILAAVAVEASEDLLAVLARDHRGQADVTAIDSNTWGEQRGLGQATEEEPEELRGSGQRSFAVGNTLRRTKENLPYLFLGKGAYKPLDPRSSQSLGQVFVKGVDVANEALRIVTPIDPAVIDEHRTRGAMIILVRGRLDKPAWALLEPYHVGLSRQKEVNQDNGEVTIEDRKEKKPTDQVGMVFDAEAWAAKTPWVQVVKQEEVDSRRRQKAWKVRRNLEMSDGKSKQ